MYGLSKVKIYVTFINYVSSGIMGKTVIPRENYQHSTNSFKTRQYEVMLLSVG